MRTSLCLLSRQCAFTTDSSYRNIAQVTGGERELRSAYLKPFNRACVESLAIMTAYSSYDGIPAIANKRMCSCYISTTNDLLIHVANLPQIS